MLLKHHGLFYMFTPCSCCCVQVHQLSPLSLQGNQALSLALQYIFTGAWVMFCLFPCISPLFFLSSIQLFHHTVIFYFLQPWQQTMAASYNLSLWCIKIIWALLCAVAIITLKHFNTIFGSYNISGDCKLNLNWCCQYPNLLIFNW